MGKVPFTFIVPVVLPFTTFIDSLSKLSIFCDKDIALLNLIYPKKLPLISKSTGIV